MSTDYYIRCVTCGEQTDCEWTNRWTPAFLIQNRLRYMDLYELAKQHHIDVEIQLDSRSVDFTFLTKHGDFHELAVYDEYGRRLVDTW